MRQNAALFSALVELAPTGVYVVDSQFRLQQINLRAKPAFAHVQPSVGRDFGEVMSLLWGPELGAQISAIFRHTMTTGEPYRSPRFAEHRVDLNEDKAYEWETQRITLPDGTHGVVCYFNDITEIEREKANLAFLATVNDDLLRLETADEVMNTIGPKICEYLKLGSGCFVEINEAADVSNVTHEWRRLDMPSLIGTYKLSDYLSEDFQTVLRAGNCFIVRDIVTDARTDAKKYAALRLHSFICAPLVSNGHWKGMFNLHDTKPRDWREDEINLVREMTARIWVRLGTGARGLDVAAERRIVCGADRGGSGRRVCGSIPSFACNRSTRWRCRLTKKWNRRSAALLTEVMHIQWGKEAGDALASIFRHTLDTGEAYVSPGYTDIRADLGEEKTYEWQTRRVTLPNGSHGVVCYFNDITERRRFEHALVEAKSAAESANRTKDEFLAALSHELRTPLNPRLLLASESADNLQLPEEVRANFDTIRKNIELEARLIDDLLDLTRILTGKMVLDRELLDVHYILVDALTTIQSDQQEKNIQMEVKLDASQSVVDGDAVRLQQVFWNVLKNAVKFTPGAGNIAVTTLNRNVDWLVIKIADTGIGMTANEVARVFKAFAAGRSRGGRAGRIALAAGFWAWRSPIILWKCMREKFRSKAPAGTRARFSRLNCPWSGKRTPDGKLNAGRRCEMFLQARTKRGRRFPFCWWRTMSSPAWCWRRC